MQGNASHRTTSQARQAMLLWLVFIVLAIAINQTLRFAMGRDVHTWTSSRTKSILFGLIIYGGLFLVAPLILTKGWEMVRQPAFALALALGVAGAALWSTYRGIGVLIVVALAFLHWRYDLSELGFWSTGWRGDILAALAVAALYAVPRLLRPTTGGLDLTRGVQAGLFRLLGNPATTAEYLFYFGFLTPRLARKLGPTATPIAIGLLYTAHEMTNPEYWYGGMQFALVGVGVALATAVYLWRKSLLPLWLGDGLARFVQGLLA
jgi:hypothetical protein